MGLVDKVLLEIDDRPVERVEAGAAFVGVKIGSRIGLAHRVEYSDEIPCKLDKYLGTKITPLIYSDNLFECALATAAINAQLEVNNFKKDNIFNKILQLAPKYETIGVVGKFPIITQLKAQGKSVYAFEKIPLAGFLPVAREEELLPKCDLVLITGTAFVNKTLERLLEICSGYTMVIGPTTPLSKALFKFGADELAGIIANDDTVLDVIAQGGGTKEFKKLVKRVTIEKV